MRSGRREMAIRSWRGFGRSGTSPGREVPAAVGDTGSGRAARERRGSGDRRAPSPVGLRCGPALTGLRPSGLSKLRAEPSRAEPTSAPRARGDASSRPDSSPAPARARHLGTSRLDSRPSTPAPPAGPPLPFAGEEPGRRERAPAHSGWRAAVGILLALALFSGASLPAAAQTVTTLVSNINQADNGRPGTIGHVETQLSSLVTNLGQRFTTGDAEGGYTLSAVDVCAFQ